MPLFLQEYLSNFFEKQKDGSLYMNTKSNIGRLLNSLISKENSEPVADDGIKIILPNNPRKISKYSRNCLSKENARQFRDYLTSYFDIEFAYWVNISERLGIEYKRSYELFLRAKKISVDAKNIEAMKKKDYRRRKNIEEKITELMQFLEY